MNFELLSPYIVFIVVTSLGALTDSLLHGVQQLEVGIVLMPAKGVRKAAFHISQYLHHSYLGFVAFDLTSLITINSGNGVYWIVLGVLFHMTAYFHTVFVLREYMLKRAKRPITHLHFVYLSVSIWLMVMITLSLVAQG